MQQERTTLDSAPGSASFAGLLASLIASKPSSTPSRTRLSTASVDSSSSRSPGSRKSENGRAELPEEDQAPGQDAVPSGLEGLEDDVATLSYQGSPESHAMPDAAQPERGDLAATRIAQPAPAAGVSAGKAGAAPGLTAGAGQNRKGVSVTVRMSKAEATQLQQRAAEAGMTVSAYLRSCTFEVETLRAQVKEVLAELRTAQTSPNTRNKPPHPLLRWLHPFHRTGATAL